MQNNKVSDAPLKKTFSLLYNFSFFIFIFYFIFYNSSIRHAVVSPVWSAINYGCMFLLFTTVFLYSVTENTSIRLGDFFYLFTLGSIGFFNLAIHQVNLANLFFLAIVVYFMRFETVIHIFFIAVFAASFIVFILSIMGMLPIYSSVTNTYVFGFVNSNTIGYYVASLGIYSILLSWSAPSLRLWFFYVVCVMLTLFVFKDYTAFLMLIIFYSLRLLILKIDWLFYNRVMMWVWVFMPIELGWLTFWVSKNVAGSSWGYSVNQLLSWRPNIWQYYLQNYSPKLLPQNVLEGLTSNLSIVGHGAFDGAYISFPVLYGWGESFLILIAVIIYLKNLFLIRNSKQIVFAITILVIGFSENIAFSSYQSPMILVAMSACLGNRGEGKAWRKEYY